MIQGRRARFATRLPLAFISRAFGAVWLFYLDRGIELFRHANQVGEGVGVHLLHDLAAMEFDRDFARAELESDLFVEQSFNHELKDFSFPRRK